MQSRGSNMKILVVRFKQIGDAILSSVICKSLKETYPDAKVGVYQI